MKSKLKFTGERMIPEKNKNQDLFYEHLARYIFACQLVKGKNVLDAGCGVGYGSLLMSNLGLAKKVVGLDLSKRAISYAKSNYKNKITSFMIGNVENLSIFHDKFFDVISSFEVIEHLNNQLIFLKEVIRCLKSSGLFIVSTPNKNTLPANNPYHTKEFSLSELKKLLIKYFRFVKIYYQEFEFSQVIKDEEKSNFAFEINLIRKTQELFRTESDPKNSQYLIAICSMKKIPKIAPISVNAKIIDGIDLTRGIIPLKNEFSQIRNDLINTKISNDEIENELNSIKQSRYYKLWVNYLEIKKILLQFAHYFVKK